MQHAGCESNGLTNGLNMGTKYMGQRWPMQTGTLKYKQKYFFSLNV